MDGLSKFKPLLRFKKLNPGVSVSWEILGCWHIAMAACLFVWESCFLKMLMVSYVKDSHHHRHQIFFYYGHLCHRCVGAYMKCTVRIMNIQSVYELS